MKEVVGGDMRGFPKWKNAILVGSFKTPGQSPRTKLLIYTTSSKQSKNSLFKNSKKKQNKIKHSLQQPEREKRNKMADLKKFHNHVNTITFLIT